MGAMYIISDFRSIPEGVSGYSGLGLGFMIGSGMLLGTAEKSYLYGFYGIAYTLSMAIGFLLLSSGILKSCAIMVSKGA